MPHVETSVEIERPQEEVFAYVTDLRNAMEWSTGLVEVTYDGELAEGTTGTDVRRMGRKDLAMPWQVTVFAPPSKLVVEYGAPFPATAAFTFEPTARGTRVTCATELRPRGLWKLLGPVMVREARRTDVVQFGKVKAILEGAGS